jgi:hypothetical protein
LQNLVFQQGKSGFQANLSDSGINLGVCAIPFALAQRQATKRAVAQLTFQKLDSAANLPEAARPATGAISAKAFPNILKPDSRSFRRLQMPALLVLLTENCLDTYVPF